MLGNKSMLVVSLSCSPIFKMREKKKKKYKSVKSAKYGQLNKTDKRWVQKKPLMVSCIITLILFVFCTGKFSSITQPLKDFLQKAAPKIFQKFTEKRLCCSPILVIRYSKVAKLHHGCFPVDFQEIFITFFL